MYYFLKKENFNLEENSFDIDISPRFTKKEHEVFSTFIKSFHIEEEVSEFEYKYLNKSKDEIEKIIQSLTKKVVNCRIYKDDVEISKMFFNLFEIVVLEKEKVIYKFSKEVKSSYEKGNFFSRVNIMAFLQFKSLATAEIFKLILKKNKRDGVLEFSVDEIKDILGIKRDKYSRYYDMERKVFKPTIKDIECANISISYEKIKSSDSKNSRISGIRLRFTNIYHMEIHKDTNELLRKYVNYIEDFTTAYDIIYQYRKIHNLEATIKYIEQNIGEIFNKSFL